MKTILLPTDFSKEAEKGYATAASIAKTFGVDIHVFNIVKSHAQELNFGYAGYDTGEELSKMDGEDIAKTQSRLNALAESAVFEGVKVTTSYSMVFEGGVVRGILDEINKKEYGLIVMGTAGEDQDEESLAEIVTRHTVTPIITCKQAVAAFNPKNILVCTDFENMTRGFIKRVADLGDNYGAKYTLLYINTHKHFKSTREIQADFKKVKRSYGVTNLELLIHNDYSVRDGVLDVVQQGDFDMLALATEGRTGISRLFMGSNTEDILNASPIPVYSYNLHEFLKSLKPHDGAGFRSGFTG